MKLQMIYIISAMSVFCFMSCDRDTLSNHSHGKEAPETKVDPNKLYSASQIEAGDDAIGAFQKLVLAAYNGHFIAAQEVACAYWPEDGDFIQKYGRDEVDAKISILERAIRKNNHIYLMNKLETDLILAGLYNKKSSAAYDPAMARSIYRSLSEDMKVDAWSQYAKMSFDGAGGGADLGEAYFYYSAICAVFDVNSFEVESAWMMRNKILEIIDPSVALSELNRLNKWFEDNGKPSPKYTVYTKDDPLTEIAIKARKEREEAHAKELHRMAQEK